LPSPRAATCSSAWVAYRRYEIALVLSLLNFLTLQVSARIKTAR
jgi:hypothetical protein